MQTFINNIWTFIKNLYDAIYNRIGVSDYASNYNTWLDTRIISGDLINIGLTWKELFLFVSTWFLLIFFICYFVKLVFKVIGLICLR